MSHLLPDTLDRMERAVASMRERLSRATASLEAAGVQYAVTGGNAVAAWVAQVDPSAIRNTNDVDLLVSREGFASVKAALESVGFFYRHAGGIDMFLDGPDGRARDAVHVLYAGEKVRPEYAFPAATLDESETGPEFRVVSLIALVRMKLTSYRRKDQVHLLDLIDVGLVDPSWVARLPGPLDDRLRHLFETPDG